MPQKSDAPSDQPLEEWQEFLLAAERRFHETLLRMRGEHPGHVSSEILEIAKSVKQVWPNELESFTWSEGGVAGEITEAFNLVNHWGQTLFRLNIWTKVYRDFERDFAQMGGDEHQRLWELRSHAIDPLAHYCMLQPSATKWRLAAVAEHAIHVGNRAVVPDYRDALVRDELKPGRWRRIDEVLKQVNQLSKARPWQAYPAFRQCLGELDSNAYKRASRNFRDLAAHGFAPSLEVGIVATLARKVVPWAEIQQQADGTWARVEVHGQKGVCYGFGGMHPLSYADACAANRQQYTLALRAMTALQELIDEIATAMNDRSSAPKNAKAGALSRDHD